MSKAGARTFQFMFNIGKSFLSYKWPKRIDGVDSFKSIPSILEEEGKKNPLIVTGPRIVKSDFFEAFVGELEGSYEIFSETRPDPTTDQVEQIVALYKEKDCDSFIAIGGGSNMDAAKAAAARIARPDRSLKMLGGTMHVLRKTPLFIAVPTTAGTGSETTVASVVTDSETGKKYAINDPNLLPDYAVLDPNLLVSLPADLTASTGMDALTHAVEAYISVSYQTKDTKKWAKEAVASIMEFIEISVAEGENLEAREEMLIASFKAGQAFSVTCVGNIHAIAHTLGGIYHVPHGKACALVMPNVLEDYGPTVYKPLSELFDACEMILQEKPADKNKLMEAKAKAFIEKIRELNDEFGIGNSYSDIKDEDIEKMATWANKEANPLYPVPVVYDKERFAAVINKIAGR